MTKATEKKRAAAGRSPADGSVPGVPAALLARFRRWYAEAEKAGQPQPDAMALGTVSRAGEPSVRFVLLKGIEPEGFVFFTDSRSQKGRDLLATGRAAATFWWQRSLRQVRIEGHVVPLDPVRSDEYWSSRPRGSQLSGATSHQSAPIASRSALLQRWRALDRRHAGRPIPRPAGWLGFRLEPRAIEFWTQKENRLHHRERFERQARGTGWEGRILQP